MSENPNQLFDCSLKTSDLESHDAFAAVPAAKGVVLFTHDDTPVQLLATANIRRAITNRFQEDSEQTEPSRKVDISTIVSDVYYTTVPNDFESKLFYHRAAGSLFGDNAHDWITLPRQTYVTINLHDACPCFRVTDKIPDASGQAFFGLFPTRKAATQYAEALNFVFGLCRNPSQFRHAQSCPYAQMDRCLGFCTGQIRKNDYLRFVHEALKATEGRMDHHLEFLQAQMKHFGIKQEFEKAQLVKEQLQQLESLNQKPYMWTSRLDDLCLLHIDKGPAQAIEGKKRKQKTYTAYVISMRSIRKISGITLEAIQVFIDYLPAVKPTEEISIECVNEHLATLSWFLYRSNRSGMWLNLGKTDRLDKEALLKQFAETFKIV
jgi:excinuclease UvrABC nuclease subunit